MNGPRTKDEKFTEKINEMQRIKDGLSDLKKIVYTFMGSFGGKTFILLFLEISTYNQNITKCVYSLYNCGNGNPIEEYSEFSEALLSIHANKNNEIFSQIVSQEI